MKYMEQKYLKTIDMSYSLLSHPSATFKDFHYPDVTTVKNFNVYFQNFSMYLKVCAWIYTHTQLYAPLPIKWLHSEV